MTARVTIRRLAAGCALALLAGTAAPAGAAPTLRSLTVVGTPDAYTDVTFPARFRLSTSATSKTPPRITGKGTYAGAYVTPLGRTGPAAGTIMLTGLPLLSDVHFPIGPSELWLPAGRYRVHLLGDAATTVRVYGEGLRRDMTVRTSKPSDVDAALLRRGVGGVTPPVDRTILPLTVRPTTLTVIANSHESTGFRGQRDMCIRRRSNGLSPCLEGNAGHGWYYGVLPHWWGLAGASAYHPGELAPGDWEVEILDATVGVPKAFYAFTLTLN